MSGLELALKIRRKNKERAVGKMLDTNRAIKNKVIELLDIELPNVEHDLDNKYRKQIDKFLSIVKIRKYSQSHLNLLKTLFSHSRSEWVRALSVFFSIKKRGDLDLNRNCLSYFYCILETESNKKEKL